MAGALTGRVVVVFGGSSGIGLATARLAQAEGASVTIIGRDAEKLRTASATIAGSDWRSTDVTDVDGVARAVAHLGVVDHVFVSVGQGGASDILMSTAEELRRRSRSECLEHSMLSGRLCRKCARARSR